MPYACVGSLIWRQRMLRRITLGLSLAGLLTVLAGTAHGLELTLPKVAASQDTMVSVDVRATASGLYAADLAVVIDTNFVMPAEGFIAAHRFQSFPEAVVMWSRVRDTVFVSMATPSPVDMRNSVLVTLNFDVLPEAPIGQVSSLHWAPFRDTQLNEEPATTTDGELYILPEGARRPVVEYFDVTLLRMPNGSAPFGSGPVPLVRTRVADENGVATIDSLLLTLPGGAVWRTTPAMCGIRYRTHRGRMRCCCRRCPDIRAGCSVSEPGIIVASSRLMPSTRCRCRFRRSPSLWLRWTRRRV